MVGSEQSQHSAQVGNVWQPEGTARYGVGHRSAAAVTQGLAFEHASASLLRRGKPSPQTTDPLSSTRLTAFSALAIPVYAVQVPLSAYLPAILAQHYGLPLTTLGLIFLLAKSWGVLTDPLVGALSDRTRNRYGRRRSWILAGGVAFGLAVLLLFFPVFGVTPIYLGIVLFVLYLSWSMIQIPYFAWSGEISAEYQQRTRVATYQTVGAAIGLLLVLLLPTLVDQFYPGADALKLGAMGAIILATLIPGLLCTLRAFPEPQAPASPSIPLRPLQTFRLILGNRLLMRVLLSDFLMTVGQLTRGALFVFFVGTYMQLPRWSSGLFLLQYVFGIAAGPLWMAIGQRLSKHRTAIAGELAQVLINLGLVFVVPGGLALLLALTIAQGLAQGSGNLMLRSMVSDVADQHRLQSGEDRTALFFSVFSISMKAGMAVAMGVALPLVAWFGFDPHATHNSTQALRGLQLTFALGPAILHALAALCIKGFPLDAAAHAQVRRQLAARGSTSIFPQSITNERRSS
jgi:GPH family glycoside/pentoside/hexuronide:cation symporter